MHCRSLVSVNEAESNAIFFLSDSETFHYFIRFFPWGERVPEFFQVGEVFLESGEDPSGDGSGILNRIFPGNVVKSIIYRNLPLKKEKDFRENTNETIDEKFS